MRRAATRHDETATIGELVEQIARHLGEGGGDDDGIEGRKIACAIEAVAVLRFDVVDPQLAQADARFADQCGDALHRHHFARKLRQYGSLVAAAETDLEHTAERPALPGLAVPRQFGHARDNVGIGNGLAETDRQRVVLVGTGLQCLVDEQVARHRPHRGQHGFVLDALLAQPLDHAAARARRGHADAGTGIQSFSHDFTPSIWL